MTDTLRPRSCPTDQWKQWIKDGARLYGRAFSTWGLLWILLYLGMGWCVAFLQEPWGSLTAWFMVGFSGIFQMMHWTIMQTVREGHVGWSQVLRSAGRMLVEQRSRLARSVVVRLITAALFLFFSQLVAVALHHAALLTADSVHSQVKVASFAPSSGWMAMLMQASNPLFITVMGPLVIQLGGSQSFVLPLAKEGLGAMPALRLDLDAYRLNRQSMASLNKVMMGLILLTLFFPVCAPWVLVFWMGVMSCAYADIFQGGYRVRALASAKVSAVAPAGLGQHA